MDEQSPAIEAQGLVKRFKDLTAVDGVSLRLERGRSLALLGPNGAGKTTLVEMLEGLQAPDEGAIRLFGQAWDESGAAALRQSLGICLQESRLPEKLAVREVLRLFAAFHGLARRGRVAYAAGFTGLGVGATRFAAEVMLDRLEGRDTQRVRTAMVRRKPLPFPPEPLASVGINLARWSLDRADHRAGRRNLFLRALDAAGLGFDS